MDHLYQLLPLPLLHLHLHLQNFPRPHHLFMVEILVAYFLRGHFTTATIPAMVLIKAQAVTVAVSLPSQVIVTEHI